MTRKKQHTHQYVRTYPHAFGSSPIDKTKGVWACALPDCTHFMPHNVADMVEGKLSLCNRCFEKFVLTRELMGIDKPICNSCAHPEDQLPFDAAEFMEVKMNIARKRGVPLEQIEDAEVHAAIETRHRMGL